MMETFKYTTKIKGGILPIPADILMQLGDERDVEVFFRPISVSSSVESDDERMLSAFEEYKAKYPDDSVDMKNFKYVGILGDAASYDSKAELIRIIEEKYGDI